MIEVELFAPIDPVWRAAGAAPEEGEEDRAPPLDVLRNCRYPPGFPRAPVIGLAAVVLTSEPIGLIRVNLGHEALASALTADPNPLSPGSAALADTLVPHLRRYVALMRE